MAFLWTELFGVKKHIGALCSLDVARHTHWVQSDFPPASVSQALNTQTTHIYKLGVPCSVCRSWLKLRLSGGYSSRALNRLQQRTGMPASDHLVGGKEDKQRRAGHGLRKDEGWTWEERRSSSERRGKELSRRRKMPSAVESTGLQDAPFAAFKCWNKRQKSEIQRVDERRTRPQRDSAMFVTFWMFLLPSAAVMLIFSPLSFCLPPAPEEGKG